MAFVNVIKIKVAEVDALAENKARRFRFLMEDYHRHSSPFVKLMMKVQGIGLESITYDFSNKTVTIKYTPWAEDILKRCEESLEYIRNQTFKEINLPPN